MNQTRLRGDKFDTDYKDERALTLFTLFSRPDGVWNAWKLGANGLLYIETMTEHTERTARASTTSRKNLGSIRVRQNVDYF